MRPLSPADAPTHPLRPALGGRGFRGGTCAVTSASCQVKSPATRRLGVFSFGAVAGKGDSRGFRKDSNPDVETCNSGREGEHFADGGSRSIDLVGVGVLGMGGLVPGI